MNFQLKVKALITPSQIQGTQKTKTALLIPIRITLSHSICQISTSSIEEVFVQDCGLSHVQNSA